MNLLSALKQNLSGVFTILSVFLIQQQALSQDIRINYINTDEFPVIEAGFTAVNKEGSKIFNAAISDFIISENSRSNKILEVNNPTQDYQPVSVVIMIDISLSMQRRRIALVKTGLAEFIDQIPLESSEVAVACFSDETYIYTDFTQNRNRLMTALNRIQNINGTNFNKAFLDPVQGALALSRGGQHKKVIIFVTDGLGVTDAERITAISNELGATVFTLNIDLPIPDDLKTLSTGTGGKFFEKIWNRVQFRSAASEIFVQLKCTDYGTVKWLSHLDCSPVKPVQLEFKKTRIEFDYDVPPGKAGKIEANPSLIRFGDGKPGLMQTQQLSIISHNIPITLKSLESDSLDAFILDDSIQYPLLLKPGTPYKLNVRFLSPDAGIYSGKLKLSLEECPDLDIALHAGGEEQIKLVFPTGGEVFTVGEDTSILWEGVKRTQSVAIDYKLKKNGEWRPVVTSKNLKYLWHLPIDTSSQAQVRLTPLKSVDENMEVTAFIEGKTTINSLFYSPDGNKIITTDSDGFVKTWNTETGKIIYSLGGYDVEKAVITADNQRLMMFLKEETFTWNLETDKLASRISKIAKKVSTSVVLPDNREVLMAGNVSVDPAKNARVWSGAGSAKLFLFNQPDIKWASFTTDSKYAVTLDIKNTVKIFSTDSALLKHTILFKEPVTEIIVSPESNLALVRQPHMLNMLDIHSGTKLFSIEKLQYQQFTPGGRYLICSEANNSVTFLDGRTGKPVLNLSGRKYYNIAPLSRYILYTQVDSLVLFDPGTHKNIFSFPGKSVKLATFNADATKVFVLTNQNTVEMFDTGDGTFLGSVEGFSRKVRDLIYNPARHQFATLMEDNRVEIWSASKTKGTKDAVSGFFTIASPKPAIIDTIHFKEQVINIKSDLIVPKFAWNPSPYSLNIKKIEIEGKNAQDFEVASRNFPTRVAPKSQHDEEFRFSPTTVGYKEAKIVTYTATDTFFTIINGTGTIGKIQPVNQYLDFGKLNVGLQKDTATVVLVNNSDNTITISEIVNSGPDEKQFSLISESTNISVAPADTLKSVVRFAPVTRGKTTSALTVNSESEQFRVILRGEGIARREIWVSGVTRNSADSLPVPAVVASIDLDSETKMEEKTTGTSGQFLFKLLADRNYGIMAEKENYISTSLNIDLSERVPRDTIRDDLYLTEIKPGAIIRLNCIFFEFDKANLLPGSETDLKRLLEILNKHKNFYFEIHGHTDSIGNDAYNLNLSKSRAITVMNYLVKNGTSKDKLSIRFYGENQPVSTNSTEEGRALNRRVELKVVK